MILETRFENLRSTVKLSLLLSCSNFYVSSNLMPSNFFPLLNSSASQYLTQHQYEHKNLRGRFILLVFG